MVPSAAKSSFFLKQREGIACLFLFVLTLFIFSPVLFFNRVFLNEEQFGFYYPINKYYQDELAGGGRMVWNSDYYGGVSAALDQFVSAYFPLKRLLFSYLSLYDAHHWMIVIGIFLGLGVTYWFGRREGWRRSSSLVFSLSYLLATTLSWLQIGTTAAYSFITLPGIALALSQITKQRRPFLYFLLGTFSIWVGLSAGFIQIVFYALFIGFLYALFLDWNAWKSEQGVGKFRTTGLFLGMAALGGLLALPQILPSASYIDLTIRTSDYAIQNAYTPSPVELVAFFFPEFVKFPFIGGGSAGFYVGVLPLIFAIIGLWFWRSKEVLFWLGVYLIILGFAFHLPVFSWINEHLPPFSRMGGNFRWMVIGAFPLAYLGGYGFNQLLQKAGELSDRQKRLTLRVLGLVSIVLIIGVGALAFAISFLEQNPRVLDRIIDWRFEGREMAFPREHYKATLFSAIDEIRSLISYRSPWFLFSVGLWPLAWVILALFFKGRLSGARFQTAALIFMSINVLVAFLPQMASGVDRAIYEKEPAIPRVLKSLETDPSSYRIMGFLVGDGLYWEAFSKRRHTEAETAAYHREFLINNSNLFWRIQRMDGMEPYRTLRANQLINTVLAADEDLRIFVPGADLSKEGLNKLDNLHAMRRVTLEEKKADFLNRLPIVSMMNVRYIYSPYELHHPDLKSVTVPKVEEISFQPKLYENTRTLPRVYFAGGAEFSSGSELNALLAVSKVADFRKTSIIECAECAPADTAGPGEVAIERYGNGALTATAVTKNGGWLIFSESFLPGWHALVDGRETPIYPANYLFQAIYVPAGIHKVEFVFRDAVSEHLARLIKQVLQ